MHRIAIVVIAALASAPPAEAQILKEIVAAPVKIAEKAVEVVVDAAEDAVEEAGNLGRNVEEEVRNLGRNAEEETRNLGRNVEEETRNLGRNVEEEVRDFGRNVEEDTRDFGRSFDKNIIRPLFKRCYDDAEQEPDPEKRRQAVEACNQKKTGQILGAVCSVGLRATLGLGPLASLAGGVACSLVGAGIDGTPNVFFSTHMDLGAPAPAPRPGAPSPAPRAPSPPGIVVNPDTGAIERIETLTPANTTWARDAIDRRLAFHDNSEGDVLGDTFLEMVKRAGPGRILWEALAPTALNHGEFDETERKLWNQYGNMLPSPPSGLAGWDLGLQLDPCRSGPCLTTPLERPLPPRSQTERIEWLRRAIEEFRREERKQQTGRLR